MNYDGVLENWLDNCSIEELEAAIERKKKEINRPQIIDIPNINIPFTLIPVKIDGDWIPDTKQEYLIEYKWNSKDKKPIYQIGYFSKAGEGLYTFYFYWGTTSFQLSLDSKNIPNPDWKRFKKIWEFHRKPNSFINESEFKI